MIDELLPDPGRQQARANLDHQGCASPGMENESAGRSLGVASDLETLFYPLVRPLLRQA